MVSAQNKLAVDVDNRMSFHDLIGESMKRWIARSSRTMTNSLRLLLFPMFSPKIKNPLACGERIAPWFTSSSPSSSERH